MPNLFDQFLATQGAMQQNDAQAISNQFNLAKLSQLQRDQEMESKSRQLGAQIAQENITKNPAPNAVTLANLSEVPDANAESQGLKAFAKETAQPATAPVPKQSEVLAQQADQLKQAALKFGAIGNLKQQDALMKESDTVREKLYLTQAEERKSEIEKQGRAAAAMKAINSQPALDDMWNSSDTQHRQALASYFNLGLDGKPIYDDKAREALDFFGSKALSAKDQSELQLKSLQREIQSKQEEVARLRAIEQTRHNTAMEANAREGNKIKVETARLKNDPFGILAPPTTGFTGTIQPNGEIAVPGTDTKPLNAALGSNIHGDEFLKLVPPALQSTVLQIAEGRGPMPSQGRNDPTNKMIRSMVNQYDPSYREGDYASGAAAEKAFTSGKIGTTVKSFNVATQHLDSLQKAADALQNGDVPAFNTIGNYIAKQTGQPAPTDFNAVKKIVGDEIVKAIVGGQNALADRQEAADSVSAANSPAQLAGVIAKYKELMAGQLEGLQKQYEASTKKTDFRQRLLIPEAKASIDKLRPEANHPSDIQSLLKKYGG